MALKKAFRRHGLKVTLVLIILVLSILLWQRENIAENKLTKAKVEIMKALMDQDYDRIKTVIDSLQK